MWGPRGGTSFRNTHELVLRLILAAAVQKSRVARCGNDVKCVPELEARDTAVREDGACAPRTGKESTWQS